MLTFDKSSTDLASVALGGAGAFAEVVRVVVPGVLGPAVLATDDALAILQVGPVRRNVGLREKKEKARSN